MRRAKRSRSASVNAARRAVVVRPRVFLASDGRPVLVRRIRWSDVPAVGAMLERCSKESLARRFATPLPRIPDALVRRLVQVDGDGIDGLVAIVRGTIVGLGHAGRMRDGTTMEIAVIVEDGYRRLGIGRLLTTQTIGLAARRGATSVVAVINADNSAALRLAHDSLPGARRRSEGSLVVVEWPAARSKPSFTAPVRVFASGAQPSS